MTLYTLYRINWGDDDNFYVMAKSMKGVLDGFPEDKGLINYVVKMDETYKMVYDAGFNVGYDAGFADSELLAKAQAEPSFKAGMREVVEWIDAHIASGYFYCPYSRLCDWQAFKKEWGI